jgi:Beta-propeller repeat
MLKSRILLGCALATLPLSGVALPIAAVAAPLAVNQNHTLSQTRYLGGVGKNEARAVAFLGNGDIIAGGNFTTLSTTGPLRSLLAGATAASPAKLLRMSPDGKQVLAQISLGNRIDSLQVRGTTIVVGGDFGVAVLDESFRTLWANKMTDLAAGDGKADGGQTRVAIEPSGRVAVLRAKTVVLFSETGQRVASKFIDRTYVNDIAIDPFGRRVYVVGYSNRTSVNPVQVAFLHALDSQNNLQELWRTWDFAANLLSNPVNNNMADSRLYRVVVGADGTVAVMGESAGGNSIYRWNGKDLTTRTQVKSDMYNDAYNTSSNHILYYAKVNASTGLVTAGQFALARLTAAQGYKGNTYRAKDGALAIDKLGRLYIVGVSAYALGDRDLNRINGRPISPYAGSDMVFLMVSADFKQRLRWTAFSDNPKGGGIMNAVAVQNNNVALFGTVSFGKLMTVNNEPRFNSPDGTVSDAYFAILKN